MNVRGFLAKRTMRKAVVTCGEQCERALQRAQDYRNAGKPECAAAWQSAAADWSHQAFREIGAFLNHAEARPCAH